MRRISLCSEKRSSFIWLSSSTTSAGSMNAVLPVADSSYMNPAIFFLFAALTGISILPSRTDTPASLSTIPSSWAFFRIALMRRDIAPSFSRRDFRISYRMSDAVSFTSPYLSTMPSIRLWTSGKFITCADILFRLGYTPSFTPSKKFVTFRSVSSMVLSLRRDTRSMAEDVFSSGFRKSMQSMNPPDGKESSNIMISLISSVRSRRPRICPPFVEKFSFAALSAAYVVEHLSDMICLIRSNPIFCSSLVSICVFLSSNSFPPYSPSEAFRSSFSSLMF